MKAARATLEQAIKLDILIAVKQALGFAAKEPTAALYVRVPVAQAAALDRVAFELKRPKRAIVSALLATLEAGANRLVVGQADLEPSPTRSRADEVLTIEELAGFLAADPDIVRDLAEQGDIPGRKFGTEWRFSRTAVLDWLGGR
jgi:excisionase family DNA binding protein